MAFLILDGYLERVPVDLELCHFLVDLGERGVREEGAVRSADGLAAVEVHPRQDILSVFQRESDKGFNDIIDIITHRIRNSF